KAALGPAAERARTARERLRGPCEERATRGAIPTIRVARCAMRRRHAVCTARARPCRPPGGLALPCPEPRCLADEPTQCPSAATRRVLLTAPGLAIPRGRRPTDHLEPHPRPLARRARRSSDALRDPRARPTRLRARVRARTAEEPAADARGPAARRARPSRRRALSRVV